LTAIAVCGTWLFSLPEQHLHFKTNTVCLWCYYLVIL